MLLQTFPSGPFSTNAYIVACPRTREAAIIDPAPNSFNQLTTFIESQQLKPKVLLLTHSHWDHIADAAPIKEKYALPVYIHPQDVENLETPGSDGLPCWINFAGVTPTNLMNENDVIEVGDLKFKVIFTPGHTPGGVCFYCAEEKVLLSGDTLFQGTIGNLSFPTARPSLMWPSLVKLGQLPPDTRVYPGHGEPTTIGDEKWLARAEQIFGADVDDDDF